MTAAPAQPKIYHIVHVDRLSSIIADGYLWSDAEVRRRGSAGTTIGMNDIKDRRLKIPFDSYPDLYVGACVPFYFCPRSVMLYVIHKGERPALTYRGGQEPIIHLEADLRAVVQWANAQPSRWVFTLSNAGSSYFEDRADLARLGDVDWLAVQARHWAGCRESKQAEFLLERCFPWTLVARIGVRTQATYNRVLAALPPAGQGHRPSLQIMSGWYY